MPIPVWKDISTYSRDDKQRAPCSFEIRFGSAIRLVVTRRIHQEGWYADCAPFFNYTKLHSSFIEEAKREALQQLCDEASELCRLLKAASEHEIGCFARANKALREAGQGRQHGCTCATPPLF